MNKKKILKIFLVFLFFILLIALLFKFFNDEKIQQNNLDNNKDENITSNIIKELSFTSKDKKGNAYILKAEEGEVDLSNDKIIYLKKITAQIVLNNSEDIIIVSDFGKYNIENYDTIFSENVIIKYLDNTITGDYLDFSFKRNTMIISRNVIYKNSNNILMSDVVEIDIETKDTKIFMYEKKKKVNIKNK